jgi:hypothetical protein
MERDMAAIANELTDIIRRARKVAREKDETRFIILMDCGEDRKWFQCSGDYLDSVEYQAFDGDVYYAVYPDGEVQTY